MKGKIIVRNLPTGRQTVGRAYTVHRIEFKDNEEFINKLYKLRVEHDLSFREIVIRFDDEITQKIKQIIDEDN